MQLKITTDYAIRTILYLAAHKTDIVSSSEVAQTMGIPRKYLLQIGAILKNEGLIDTHPGKNGGYSLAKRAKEILLYDVIAVMEDTMRLNRCLESDGFCSRYAADTCPVHKYYERIQNVMDQYLKSVTIQDILDGKL